MKETRQRQFKLIPGGATASSILGRFYRGCWDCGALLPLDAKTFVCSECLNERTAPKAQAGRIVK